MNMFFMAVFLIATQTVFAKPLLCHNVSDRPGEPAILHVEIINSSTLALSYTSGKGKIINQRFMKSSAKKSSNEIYTILLSEDEQYEIGHLEIDFHSKDMWINTFGSVYGHMRFECKISDVK